MCGFKCLPLEVSGHGDLAVDQGLHHPANHLIERPRHVFTELSLKTPLDILPVGQAEERTSLETKNS